MREAALRHVLEQQQSTGRSKAKCKGKGRRTEGEAGDSAPDPEEGEEEEEDGWQDDFTAPGEGEAGTEGGADGVSGGGGGGLQADLGENVVYMDDLVGAAHTHGLSPATAAPSRGRAVHEYEPSPLNPKAGSAGGSPVRASPSGLGLGAEGRGGEGSGMEESPSPEKGGKRAAKKDYHKDPYHLPPMETSLSTVGLRPGLARNHRPSSDSSVPQQQQKTRAVAHRSARPSTSTSTSASTSSSSVPTKVRAPTARPKKDERFATEAELRQLLSTLKPEDLSVSSSTLFASLPAALQYELVGDMRAQSRGTSYKRLMAMQAAAPTAADFSKQQVLGLKTRNEWTQRVLEVTDQIGSANIKVDVAASRMDKGRIAGQRGREYVLVRNDKDGGFVLGSAAGAASRVGEGASREKAIDVEALERGTQDADLIWSDDGDDVEVDEDTRRSRNRRGTVRDGASRRTDEQRQRHRQLAEHTTDEEVFEEVALPPPLSPGVGEYGASPHRASAPPRAAASSSSKSGSANGKSRGKGKGKDDDDVLARLQDEHGDVFANKELALSLIQQRAKAHAKQTRKEAGIRSIEDLMDEDQEEGAEDEEEVEEVGVGRNAAAFSAGSASTGSASRTKARRSLFRDRSTLTTVDTIMLSDEELDAGANDEEQEPDAFLEDILLRDTSHLALPNSVSGQPALHVEDEELEDFGADAYDVAHYGSSAARGDSPLQAAAGDARLEDTTFEEVEAPSPVEEAPRAPSPPIPPRRRPAVDSEPADQPQGTHGGTAALGFRYEDRAGFPASLNKSLFARDERRRKEFEQGLLVHEEDKPEVKAAASPTKSPLRRSTSRPELDFPAVSPGKAAQESVKKRGFADRNAADDNRAQKTEAKQDLPSAVVAKPASPLKAIPPPKSEPSKPETEAVPINSDPAVAEEAAKVTAPVAVVKDDDTKLDEIAPELVDARDTPSVSAAVESPSPAAMPAELATKVTSQVREPEAFNLSCICSHVRFSCAWQIQRTSIRPQLEEKSASEPIPQVKVAADAPAPSPVRPQIQVIAPESDTPSLSEDDRDQAASGSDSDSDVAPPVILGADGFPLPTLEELDAADEDDEDMEGLIRRETEGLTSIMKQSRQPETGRKTFRQMQEEAKDEVQALQEQFATSRRTEEDVTLQMAYDVQFMLRQFGIPYITGPMEAEAQCAELVRLGLCEGIVTDDSDVFLFGGERVFKNMFNDNKTVQCYVSDDLLRDVGLDRLKLIRLAYLLGSDYTDGLEGVGVVLAMEILSVFRGDDGLVDFRNWWLQVQQGQDADYLPPGKWSGEEKRQIRKRLKRIKKTLVKKVHLTAEWPDPKVADAYLEPDVDSTEDPFAWGMPDLEQVRKCLMLFLGWSVEKVDGYVVPVMESMMRRGRGGGGQTRLGDSTFFDTSAGRGAYAPRQKLAFGSSRLQEVINGFRSARNASRDKEDAISSDSGVEQVSSDEEATGNKKRKRAPARGAAKKAPAKKNSRARGKAATRTRGKGRKAAASRKKKTKDVETEDEEMEEVQAEPAAAEAGEEAEAGGESELSDEAPLAKQAKTKGKKAQPRPRPRPVKPAPTEFTSGRGAGARNLQLARNMSFDDLSALPEGKTGPLSPSRLSPNAASPRGERASTTPQPQPRSQSQQ